MRISVSAPGRNLEADDVEGIERDLEKIDRRLKGFKQEVAVSVRLSDAQGPVPGHHVVIELDYGRTHLLAKAESPDVGQAVRTAREELLRQINDRSRGGHSDFAKHT
ncbi:MAG TPA: HPF/RaiA family ribosome-associated protein [Actinomycetota bacterium]|nr:HPF/RaiA family ribosome-associated protein [Actinomycetota bacterium]